MVVDHLSKLIAGCKALPRDICPLVSEEPPRYALSLAPLERAKDSLSTRVEYCRFIAINGIITDFRSFSLDLLQQADIVNCGATL